MLATQLARQFGLTVLATTRNPGKTALLFDNGTSHVLIDNGNVDAKVRVILPDGVDNVLELVGSSTLKDSLRCASRGGAVCMTGKEERRYMFERASVRKSKPLTCPMLF